jgi:PEP-CTERM motif
LSYTDTIAALNLSLLRPGVDVDPGGLRIGIHVQGFANGGSESFVNGPPGGGPSPAAVPEPSTVLGASFAGLIGLAYAWRRRKA